VINLKSLKMRRCAGLWTNWANGMGYQITLICTGVPSQVGPELATDVAEEFTHRPWHQNLSCKWDGTMLILQAENDWDADAKALTDEFSDAVSANTDVFEGDIEIHSITVMPANSNESTT
jgi:hypothetical protein